MPSGQLLSIGALPRLVAGFLSCVCSHAYGIRDSNANAYRGSDAYCDPNLARSAYAYPHCGACAYPHCGACAYPHCGACAYPCSYFYADRKG